MYKWCAWWRAPAIMVLTVHQLHDDDNRARGYRTEKNIVTKNYCNFCNERVLKVYRHHSIRKESKSCTIY